MTMTSTAVKIECDFQYTYFRRKMNQKITFKDVIVAGSAAQNHDKCFSYVFEEHRIENFQTIFLNYNRDFDVLQEALGNFEYIMVIFHECANN